MKLPVREKVVLAVLSGVCGLSFGALVLRRVRRGAAEGSLPVSERLLRTVIERSPRGVCFFTPDGEMLLSNRVWREGFGFGGPSGAANVFEDGRLAATGVTGYARKSVDGGVTVETPALRYDPERWLEAVVYPVMDASGAVVEVAVVVDDVTERERAAKELERSEDRFRSMVQNAPDIIAVLGEDGSVRYASPAIRQLLGYNAGDFVGQDAFSLVHPDDVSVVREAFEEVLVSGGPRSPIEFRFWHADGFWRHLEVRSRRLGDRSGGRELLVNARDVTGRRSDENELRLGRQAIAASSNGIVITDAREPDGRILYYNPAMERITGYEAGEAIDRDAGFLVGPDPDEPEVRRLYRALRAGEEFSGVLRNRRKDGDLFWSEMYVSPVHDERGRLTNYVWILNDVSDRKALESELTHRAFHDSLTGLANRALFKDHLRQALERVRRSDSGIAVLFMDLDNFKQVNDSMGHEVGDRLLVEAGHRIRVCIRPSDTAARIGGDEFAVLLEGICGTEDAVRVAQRIITSLEAPFELSGQEFSARTSIGISMTPIGGDSVRSEDLLRDADAAMYEAKRRGGGGYEVFKAGMGPQVSGEVRRGLENSLRRAADSPAEEFRLRYQPKSLVGEGRTLGFEVLLRWESPEHGTLSPQDFMPLAEETGLMVPIGQWVFEEACRQARVWRDRYGDAAPPVWVNLSARQFRYPDLTGQISSAIEETGLGQGALGLEIPERVLTEGGSSTIPKLRELKSLGVRLAVDGFGTGYASLSYLSRLPVESLNIDRSFVFGITKSPESAVLVSAMVGLGRALGLKVIAQGVESDDQLARLEEMKCEGIQGYWISYPLPPLDASAFLQEHL